MILAKSYKEIMDKIEVTEEMRKRILENIYNIDIKPEERKIYKFPFYARYMVAAACIVTIITATVLIAHKTLKEPEPPVSYVQNTEEPGPVADVPLFEEAVSAEELSEKAGFIIGDIKNLPFKAEKTNYVLISGETAEISYIKGNKTVIFRKSKGNGDNSGDYTAYEKTVIKDFGFGEVTLKGSKKTYNLAVWENGGYSYSLHCKKGVPENTIKNIIIQIK